MSNIHLAQVCFIKPILDTVQLQGGDIDRLLKSSGLNKFDTTVDENYIPQHLILKLLKTIKQEVNGNFLETFHDQINLSQLSQWGDTVTYAPDLLSACKFAVKYEHIVLTNQRISLEIRGPVTKVSQSYTDTSPINRSSLESADLSLLLSGFQIAVGDLESLIEIHLQSNIEPNLDVILPSGNNTKVLLNQPTTAIIFPTRLLNKSMKKNNEETEIITEFSENPPGIRETIEMIFESFDSGNLQYMQLVSNSLDMSSRTLQRHLSNEGCSFSEVVDDWRFKQSLTLLDKQSFRIKEISEYLGYANVANFDRAFNRWTGTSPSKYREAI